MIVAIKVPDFGVTVDTVTLYKWFVAEGTEVVRGQTIAEIEADKAVVILESVASGVLLKIVASEGAQVSTGEVIAFAGDPTDTVPQNWEGAPSAPLSPEPFPKSEPRFISKPRVSAILRNLASQKGVDIDRVFGTGHDLMITREDILAAAASQKSEH